MDLQPVSETPDYVYISKCSLKIDIWRSFFGPLVESGEIGLKK
jgi:hypothetical protein